MLDKIRERQISRSGFTMVDADLLENAASPHKEPPTNHHRRDDELALDVGTSPGNVSGTEMDSIDLTEDGIEREEAIRRASIESLKDGKRAWVVCFGAFLIQVLNVGTLHAYGVFFVQFIKEFNSSKATTAWVGAAAYGLTMSFGVPSSMLINRFGPTPVAMVGSTICVISLVATSFAPSINMMFLTFSVLYGIGASFAYTPTMCIADDYFKKYVTLATGIMTAGSSCGTLILNPLSQVMSSHLGWRNAMRILAAISVITIGAGFTFRPLVPKLKNRTASMIIKKSKARPVIAELQLWKNRVYIIWIAAITLVMFGYYIPYVHLVSHAIDIGIPPEMGSLLVMVLGAATATGRVMFGKIVEGGYLNRLHMHQLSMVVTGTGTMMLPIIQSFGGLVAYVIIVGLVDGCYVVLLPVLTSTLAGAENKVLGWGFLVGISSVTYTLGPPVAGWLYDYSGSYNLSFHVAGVPIVLGAVVLFFIPWAQKTGRGTNLMSAARSSYKTVSTKDESPQDTFGPSPPTSVTSQDSSALDRAEIRLEFMPSANSDDNIHHRHDTEAYMRKTSKSVAFKADDTNQSKQKRVRSVTVCEEHPFSNWSNKPTNKQHSDSSNVSREIISALDIFKRQSNSLLEVDQRLTRTRRNTTATSGMEET